MMFSGLITRIGEVKDAPLPQTGPRGKPLSVEIGTTSTPAGQFIEIEISQDAALELVQRLTARLSDRGCL
jgi:hypothetical protein